MIVVQILQGLVFIGSLVCFILVVIKMFQNNQTGLGIACLLLCWCVGPLIAFVYGWIKSSEWNIKNIMLIWSGLFAAAILLAAVSAAMGGFSSQAFQPQLHH